MQLARLILSITVLVCGLIGSVQSFAEVDRSIGATVTTQRTDQTALLKVEPPMGTHLNFDGPWKLDVTGTLPLKNETGSFKVDAFDKATRTFTLPFAKKPSPEQKSQFTLTYFYCAEDNTWCKRAEAKGDL